MGGKGERKKADNFDLQHQMSDLGEKVQGRDSIGAKDLTRSKKRRSRESSASFQNEETRAATPIDTEANPYVQSENPFGEQKMPLHMKALITFGIRKSH